MYFIKYYTRCLHILEKNSNMYIDNFVKPINIWYNVINLGEAVVIVKRRKRKPSFLKLKILLSVLVFTAITGALGYNCLSNILKIYDMKQEKKQLETKIVDLQAEKEMLEGDILRLEDPEYIAKYVREKYFYSKDGEFILRLD